MQNLRGYNTSYQILRNINNPVIFLGLPLRLAKWYMTVIVTAAIIGVALGRFQNVPLLFQIGLPAILGFGGVYLIREFDKKYGIHGFYLKRKDKNMPNAIIANKSIQQIFCD